MKVWSKRLILTAAGIAAGWMVGFGLTNRAAAQAPVPPGAKAGTYFKNVTTSTLKELTPDDFLSAMGVMADSLGLDCADCHPGAGTDKVDWVFDTPAKKTARKMVEMVASINKTNFAGVADGDVLHVPSRAGRTVDHNFAGCPLQHAEHGEGRSDQGRSDAAARRADPRQIHRGAGRAGEAERPHQLCPERREYRL